MGLNNSAGGVSDFIDCFGKKNNSNRNNGDGNNFKKLRSNNEANEYAKSRGYRDAHDLKESHVGRGNESKFDIEVDFITKEGRLISKDGKVIVPIY
ncbi:MAG: hypothetical protein NXH86_00380 [Flavobacteriaceae bacterium]|uniref:hypothetical protein n=1 Tax=Flagellimonas TaxID=444459 RepID=UPI003BAA806D|nr:hypothetical protein [Flavobacteriaceae bacterium]